MRREMFQTPCMILVLFMAPVIYAQPKPDAGTKPVEVLATVPVVTTPGTAAVAPVIPATPAPEVPVVKTEAPTNMTNLTVPVEVTVPEVDSFFTSTIKSIASATIPVLGSILTALASYALLLLAQKYKLSLNVAKESIVRLVIRRFIASAEEVAAAALKVTPQKPKLDKLEFVMKLLLDRFPTIASKTLNQMIHEELAQMPGVGATGKLAIKTDQ